MIARASLLITLPNSQRGRRTFFMTRDMWGCSGGAQNICHTYSIVARDQETGELGVAVQSHWFSVGSVVAWAEAGIGAVATQSIVECSYGPLGLELMRAGKSAPDVLRALLAADDHTDVRQVAMVDAQGKVAVHTGEHCIAEAGHRVGVQFSTQANMMLKDTVWNAMADAYGTSKGDLTDRLLTALQAAENERGDIRGRQSAALIVVRPKSTGRLWEDRVFDLRVEDHPDPVRELKRLVQLSRAYQHMNHGDELMAKGDISAACIEYGSAERLAPHNVEMVFWHAVTLANSGRIEEALPLFKNAFEADRNWMTLLSRLPRSKLFPDDPTLIEKILRASRT
jgi:uncharacterized Ntn-hydrolase superfamily protein